jgi:precorrin-2 dehydrogenase / sirohydrochlorin ferrochelatase
MNGFYPIHVQLAGKKVTIIGGGRVAERKLKNLIGTGAIIEIISPNVTLEIKELILKHSICWKQKIYTNDDLSNTFMIIAATNNRSVNQEIAEEFRDQLLVNISDDPKASNFLIPSLIKRGKLTISVSTEGASPILSSHIREKIEKEFDQRYEEYLEFLYNSRQLILASVSDPLKRKELLSAIVDPKFLNSETREIDFQVLYNNIMST